jgi:hypothetical protein
MTKIAAVENLWKILPDLERVSKESLHTSLNGWEELVKNCIEAGALAPMIPSQHHGDVRLSASAPFLKRALDDLRVVWLLIEVGYSAQAAAVAAALFENALTAEVIAESKALAQIALNAKNAQIPWAAKELCQLSGKREINVAAKRGEKVTSKEYEDGWTIAYFHYKWLCQIKHPTWQVANHALQSTLVNKKEFAVRPGPNNIPDDVQVKARIVAVSLTRTLGAIKSFFLTLESDETLKESESFEEKITKVHFGIMEQIKRQYGKPSPIAVLDRSFIKTDFATLKSRFGE